MKKVFFPAILFCCLTGILSLNAAAQILLNEIDVNPGGTDNGCEYVELIGPPGTSTNDLYFVSLEGDSNKGQATVVVQFGTSTQAGPPIGSNGLLVLTSAAGCAPRTYGAGTGTMVVTTSFFDSGVLQNGSNSFLLIFSPTTPITTGTTPTDYDTNDDGVLELPAGAVIVDGVAWRDSGATDVVYGNAVLTANGASDGTPIGAATRFSGNNYPNTLSAWYAGNRVGTPSDLTYHASVRTANFPPDGALTPGTPNAGTRDAAVDMNFDGKTEYSIIRPTGGQYVWHSYAGNGNFLPVVTWGVTGDIALSGDYDGDGKDDVAVYRPSDSTFYIVRSTDSTILIVPFGQTGDDPRVVGDYTGDGIDDVAVYRAGSPSTWYYRTVGFYNAVAWGETGDTPAPGDYNGDGRADFGIRRNVNGVSQFWRFVNGANLAISIEEVGAANALVVPGDYDGDGKTDSAVASPEGGVYKWSFKPSGTPGAAIVTENWGNVGDDIPAQGDFDNDGRTDLVVYRKSDGRFYVFSIPTRSITFQAWGGQAGDFPVGNFNVH